MRNQRGNSGFETADNLVGTTSLIHVASPNLISMAWATKYVEHLRAVNNNLLDTYQLKSRNALLDARIKRIERQDDRKYIRHLRKQPKSYYNYLLNCDRITAKVVTLYTRIGI